MKRFWEFTATNIDTLAAIAVSILAAVYGVFGGSQTYLLAGIAGTLAVLAFSLIRDRKSRETLEKQITELRGQLPEHPSASAFFRKPPDLAPFIQQAIQIDLCGVTLTSTINKQSAMLRKHLENGGRLRVLLIDPESQAIEMTAQRSVSVKDTDYYSRRLESTLVDIAYLIKYTRPAKPARAKSARSGSISVRLMSYAPSFGMYSFDPRRKNGIIFVEVYPHKYGFQLSPTFELTPENDKDWYRYFADQFEEMWKEAADWDPKPFLKKIASRK
jgi:hypothetical protein